MSNTKENPADKSTGFSFGAGYGSRTRLHGLGSRCITDIRTLRSIDVIITEQHRKFKSFLSIASIILHSDFNAKILLLKSHLFCNFFLCKNCIRRSYNPLIFHIIEPVDNRNHLTCEFL